MRKTIPTLFLVLSLTSCGGRLPSPKTAHHIITKQFQKYGKKYQESDFGKYRLKKAEIFEIHEIQKNLAEVLAYAHLEGDRTYRVRFTLQKKPFGWRSLAWENLEGR